MYVVPNAPEFLAIEKNGDSDDQGDQRNAITGEIYSRRDNLCTALDRWLAKISTEAIVAVVAPDTVCSAPTARVLGAVVADPIQFIETW